MTTHLCTFDRRKRNAMTVLLFVILAAQVALAGAVAAAVCRGKLRSAAWQLRSPVQWRYRSRSSPSWSPAEHWCSAAN